MGAQERGVWEGEVRGFGGKGGVVGQGPGGIVPWLARGSPKTGLAASEL